MTKPLKWHNYHAGPPHWNKRKTSSLINPDKTVKARLYAVTPDGKKHWKLTDNELNEGWHDWSPDGKWLAFEMLTRKIRIRDLSDEL